MRCVQLPRVILLFEEEKSVLNRWFLENANVDLLTN